MFIYIIGLIRRDKINGYKTAATIAVLSPPPVVELYTLRCFCLPAVRAESWKAAKRKEKEEIYYLGIRK